MSHRFDVAGFGESSVDHVFVVPRLPGASHSKVRISRRFSAPGGQVATTMAGCAAFGLRAAYLGPVGDDENGRMLQEELRRRNVSLEHLVVHRAATRYAVILVDERSGERFILWDRDQALDIAPAELDAMAVPPARIVHVDATDEGAAIRLARFARAEGAIVTCDVDQVTARTWDLLSEVTIPILAADVPARLTGLTDPESGLRALRVRHPGLLCVTLGERGAAALEDDRFIAVPALGVDAVDTTGAGDVFRAGLIYAVAQGWPTTEGLRFANAAAALSCTRPGAMNSVPTLVETEALLSST